MTSAGTLGLKRLFLNKTDATDVVPSVLYRVCMCEEDAHDIVSDHNMIMILGYTSTLGY